MIPRFEDPGTPVRHRKRPARGGTPVPGGSARGDAAGLERGPDKIEEERAGPEEGRVAVHGEEVPPEQRVARESAHDHALARPGRPLGQSDPDALGDQVAEDTQVTDPVG